MKWEECLTKLGFDAEFSAVQTWMFGVWDEANNHADSLKRDGRTKWASQGVDRFTNWERDLPIDLAEITTALQIRDVGKDLGVDELDDETDTESAFNTVVTGTKPSRKRGDVIYAEDLESVAESVTESELGHAEVELELVLDMVAETEAEAKRSKSLSREREVSCDQAREQVGAFLQGIKRKKKPVVQPKDVPLPKDVEPITDNTIKRQMRDRATALQTLKAHQARLRNQCLIPAPQRVQRTTSLYSLVSEGEGGGDGGGAIIGIVALFVLLALSTPHGGGY
jgi:hypothetical protein